MAEAKKQQERCTGKVKWFNAKKGFGFITPTNGGADIFVHQTAIHARAFRSLAVDEDVEYKIDVDNNKRQKAVDVTGPNHDFVKGTSKPEYNHKPRPVKQQ